MGESLSGDENSNAVPLNAVLLLLVRVMLLSEALGNFFGAAIFSPLFMRLRSRPGVLPLADFTYADLVVDGGVLNSFGVSTRLVLSSSFCVPLVFRLLRSFDGDNFSVSLIGLEVAGVGVGGKFSASAAS